MKKGKRYIISSNTNRIKFFKSKKKKIIKEEKDELILLAHNICVEGMSKQHAESVIANYVKNIKDYIDLEKEIKGYKIHHYISISSPSKQGIELLHPQMKEEIDSMTKNGLTTEKALNRLSKVYKILSGK